MTLQDLLEVCEQFRDLGPAVAGAEAFRQSGVGAVLLVAEAP